MTRKDLEEYRSKKEEVAELRYKLKHLGENDSLIGNSTVLDYRAGYPRPQSVIGYDKKEEERLRNLYGSRIDRLTAECEDVERWVEEIRDSIIRRIFRMYYIDGVSQVKISRKLHMHQSRISRKIDEYLNKCKNA